MNRKKTSYNSCLEIIKMIYKCKKVFVFLLHEKKNEWKIVYFISIVVINNWFLQSQKQAT